jgi:ParB family transcriptional regulator, chromosome partitioning protein
MTQFKTIPLSSLQPSAENPRHSFDEDEQEQLTQSVEADGVLQPVIVRPTPQGFEVVAGERRRRAASSAGLRDVPAVVRNLSDKQAFLLSLKENLVRSDLTIIEEAEAYLKLRDRYGWKGNEIAREFMHTDAYVYSMLQLASGCEALKQAVDYGRIPKTVGYLIARVEERDLQEQATLEAQRMVKGESESAEQAARHIRENYLGKKLRSKSTPRTSLVRRRPRGTEKPDYVKEWVRYLLEFNAAQLLAWQEICRKRQEVTVIIMAEAVEAVMMQHREEQAS